VKKPRGRPFQPGNTFGRGRPKGSRNRDTAPAKTLLEEYTPHLTRKLIALALEGNAQALRICMERIMPAPRDACVPIKLPKIKSAEDIASAAEKVMRSIGIEPTLRSTAVRRRELLQFLRRALVEP